MFVSNSKTVVYSLTPAIGSNVYPLTQAIGSDGSLNKFPAASIPPVTKDLLSLQVRSKKEKFRVQGTVNSITRRELMHFTAASFSAIALFLAEPSEARVRKPEVRRKILEKLELERKKAGVSKQKNNDFEKLTRQPKEGDPSLPTFPDLQSRRAQSLVEATMS